jgi:hypothetical protein
MTTFRRLWTLFGIGAASLALVACVTPPGDPFASAISDDGLARLRQCESGGNYSIVSASGAYRGAYQFSRGTWNGVARRHYPHLDGVDPAAAAPWDQDRMARALWATGGPGHWPVCSRRV